MAKEMTTEYKFYTNILNPNFLARNQKEMREDKEKHVVGIDAKRVDYYKLYRFDLENQNFLPFFNESGKDENPNHPTPHGLRKFCDYILLAEVGKKLYVVLVEMKSGQTGTAKIQLDASETFMEYVRNSAERVKDNLTYSTFDRNKVFVKRVILKAVPSSVKHRSKTKMSGSLPTNSNGDILLTDERMSITHICGE